MKLRAPPGLLAPTTAAGISPLHRCVVATPRILSHFTGSVFPPFPGQRFLRPRNTAAQQSPPFSRAGTHTPWLPSGGRGSGLRRKVGEPHRPASSRLWRGARGTEGGRRRGAGCAELGGGDSPARGLGGGLLTQRRHPRGCSPASLAPCHLRRR